MIIIPAIDIIDGKPVRLYKGDYNKKELVGDSILEIAKSFEKANCSYIHIVDLDGAKQGELVNLDIILEVIKNIKVNVEVGGGIRNIESIEKLINGGASRVILGTSAIEDLNFLKEVIKNYGEKIAVSIDCKDGFLCGRGWLSNTSINYLDFAKKLEDIGVKNIIVTDISKDGTLEGPNLDMLKELKNFVNIYITASGGIRDINNIKELKKLNVYGAITGKAIYKNTLSLKEAINECEKKGDSYAY
ncbi:MAG: 1-(5-phosphoribosyl)-5-[(5-phosphoribosylamino)methylideneamino]imidazole-4-carboxamide isomerase [Clostridium baratii]|uniref:1-(5-phosphoribosyl)-5-[(5-phosphoribosylamino)methylideneamino] imidazole-4-carboxamide isomerase n=1 Tax=Clostridium baratii str. Sullivan TaxID=1415775 RepID=A0A0A7FXS8_9CLOT|nr:1-(5-phosphoribosyl)-5-[(5-phosphoribosylamino)methylideneamino]imidazole-4-carboxamide isomerase [Clostridium baratii]AIY84407.1 1-(5-phosphoribosyl)-5-[(5-phosphoribosylamino)methylideneamino]imidazole-4-carboxamide isomerase [Clostridium baratii str. Sullivan]MBS6005612.1 1-(5-phosphoribosyl)-5-[(5-phosphoribosylamino)methylideneamino]imidazole-4-carboxamide isomerase [Clostridium baratii]MDU1052678.1 1-(5-phosphoribosyl)-5-[(5-phosphoribosylamino)methylideneamino]imidazole-4-carboxamide i